MMMDQNLNLANRRGHRGGFFTGAGVLCVTAIVLAGCAGLSKKKDSFAAPGQPSQVEAEQARLAKSERARKSAVQKLARALATNKTLKKQLADAKHTTRKFRDEFQAADKDIADLELQLAKAKAQPVEPEKTRRAAQQSGQLVESLKARLDKANNERDVLKAQLDEAQKDSAQVIEKMLAAASREAKESRAENKKLTKQLQAVQAKADSALKDRTQVEQATAKQAEALRDQLATAKQQVSDAQAAAKAARIELATANAEIARLKVEPAEKPTSSAAQ
jgi:chromosome segregation ATPase